VPQQKASPPPSDTEPELPSSVVVAAHICAVKTLRRVMLPVMWLNILRCTPFTIFFDQPPKIRNATHYSAMMTGAVKHSTKK
jgi:hypothetical protein